MQIIVTGITHETAPLAVREVLAIGEEELPRALDELRTTVAECFALSTCNRVELYAVCGHAETGSENLRRWLADRSGLSAAEVHAHSYTLGHEAAVTHALRVAGGLESMIVGEAEILGQMRRAITEARKAGALGPVLDRLGSTALACGKRIRSASAAGRDAPSAVSVGLGHVAAVRGSLDGARVLVIGGGQTATHVVRQLSGARAVDVTIVNRTAETAAALALAMGVQAAPWDLLPRLVGTADVIIGCTASRRPVLTVGTMRAARQAAPHPVVCLDLGVPRDIDPSVRELEGVTLIDVDRLGGAPHITPPDVRRRLDRAEELVANEVDRFMSWWRERDVIPTITRLHAHARQIQAMELERALARLGGLSPRDRHVVRTLAGRITAKLVHDPTIVMKRDPEGANLASAVERLFHLTTPDDSRRGSDDPIRSVRPRPSDSEAIDLAC